MSSSDEEVVNGIIFGVIITLFLVGLVGGFISFQTSIKNKTITSNVISVVPEDNWYFVKFANGESYRIGKYSYVGQGILDFDKSERVIVELQWSSGWLTPNTDDVWGVVKIVKW